MGIFMNLFDEIIETLKCEQEISEYTYISPETLKSFYSVTDELREEISKDRQRLSKTDIHAESSASGRSASRSECPRRDER